MPAAVPNRSPKRFASRWPCFATKFRQIRRCYLRTAPIRNTVVPPQFPNPSPVPAIFAPDGFLLNRLRFYDFPIAFSAGDFKTFLLWASEHKPEHVREIEML